jgi:hypothetical protein
MQGGRNTIYLYIIGECTHAHQAKRIMPLSKSLIYVIQVVQTCTSKPRSALDTVKNPLPKGRGFLGDKRPVHF